MVDDVKRMWQGAVRPAKRLAKRVGDSKVGQVVKKVPKPIRKGFLAGAMVPVPGAAEAGALAGAAKWGHDAIEGAVRKKTGKPYRLLFETPARRILTEFMGVYAGGDPGKGAVVSEKLDGVYARATKDGLFSKSGKPLDVPKVQKRLRRYFRKNPDGELEGELWRKKMPVEEIAGAVRSGGDATKRLRLHVFPKDGPARPWSIGAVRRVKGRKAETEKDVEKVFQRALKRGREGVVVRGADGVPLKKKPREDAEYEVVGMRKAEGGQREIYTVRDGQRTFRVQGRPGVVAKTGEKLQVSYSGKTRKGVPKAAVAERVRNDTDFEEKSEIRNQKSEMNATRFETPAQRVLGYEFAGRRDQEEIERDRRTLKRIAAGAAAAGGAAGLAVGLGKRMDPRKVRARKLVKEGVMTRREAGIGLLGFEEKRDGLSKARDVVIIGGAGGAGIGGLVMAREAKKAGRKANEVLERAGKAADSMREVTPGSVAREGGKLVKKKVKEMFPTFAKVGRAMRRTALESGEWHMRFATPARKMNIHEVLFHPEFQIMGYHVTDLAAAAVDRSKVRNDDGRWVDHWKVASGMQKGYTSDGREARVGMLDPAVLKSLKRKADVANKWGTRGGGFVKDAAAVVQGKPRERDASGRKKKREWEKGWFKDTVKKGALIAGGIGYGIAYKKSPGLRRRHDSVVRTVRRKADDVRDAISNFETPAMRILNFGKRDDRDAAVAGVKGAAVGGVNGALIGGVSAVHSKEADDYFDIQKMRQAERQGRVAVMQREAKPFQEKGKFGKAERIARAKHEAMKRAEQQVKKTMRNRAIVGGVGGAALLGGLSYAAAKAQKPEARGQRKRNFHTPAREMLIELDEAAEWAGWDVRDPRGRSARVFAPGSRRRERREKKWHEKVENERKLWGAGAVGASVLAGAAGLAVGRKMKVKTAAVPGAETLPLKDRIARAGRKIMGKPEPDPNNPIVPFPKRKRA